MKIDTGTIKCVCAQIDKLLCEVNAMHLLGEDGFERTKLGLLDSCCKLLTFLDDRFQWEVMFDGCEDLAAYVVYAIQTNWWLVATDVVADRKENRSTMWELYERHVRWITGRVVGE